MMEMIMEINLRVVVNVVQTTPSKHHTVKKLKHCPIELVNPTTRNIPNSSGALDARATTLFMLPMAPEDMTRYHMLRGCAGIRHAS